MPKMYLEYSPISMLIFLSPCGLCSRSLCACISMGREKMYFLVHKVIRNRSIWGPCQFLIFITKHLVIFFLSICLETWNNLYGKNLEKWRICMEHVKDFKRKIENCMEKCWIWLNKWKNLYGKMTNSSGQAKKFIWPNGILSIGFLASIVY